MADTVAIIGMAFRLPGAATEEALWDLLSSGGSAIRPIPAERWAVDDFHHPVPGTPGRTVMRRGGFLDAIDKFDERFFGISPREARAMDPQQRMLLEETWHCLEDAGIRPSSLAGREVGVFTGVMATDYLENANQPEGETDGYSALGTYGAILANRISHFFRWTGPSFTIDAACASSLVALHQARRALLTGECELAVVAAANALINPWRSISFSNARMLSAEGECRTFDAAAKGYVQGEGAAVLLLARQRDVASLGARIRALVPGSAVNHVGPSQGITQPSVAAQRSVIESALSQAGVTPDAISYVEAHGTGTPLGDPIEVAALSDVLAGPRAEPCRIGAIKPNIGHLEAAAGLAGVIKVVLMLERRRLLPNRNLATVNPLINFTTGPLRPVTETTDWTGDVLRAGVSSFGFGGANAHVVLQGAPDTPPARRRPAMPSPTAPQPLVLSAATPASLDSLRGAMRTAAARAAEEGMPLTAFCQTLLRRETLPCRIAGMVGDWRDVDHLLSETPSSTAAPARRPRVVMRFGGIQEVYDGTWLPMQRDLPAAADAYDEAEALARAQGARRSPRLVTLARLYAIGSILMRAGVTPDLLYGEGAGFWVTLALAGVVTLADAVAATGEAQPTSLVLRRPRLAVYDRGTDRILAPNTVGPGYLALLREGWNAALPMAGAFAAYGASLAATNQTSRNFLADWTPAFASHGLPPVEALLTAPPADPLAQRLLILAVAVTRRRTCARWAIPETGPVLPPLADELAHLVAQGALSPLAAAALAAEAPAFDSLAAGIDLSVLPTGWAEKELPQLTAGASALETIADPEAWLRGYPGRPRKPAPMAADLTLDIGRVGVAAEGRHLPLPLGQGFFAGLCQILCQHWQEGGDTRWQLLERRQAPVPLPLYPFDRRPHWIALDWRRHQAAPTVAPAIAPAGPPSLKGPGVPTHRPTWGGAQGAPAPLPAPLALLTGHSEHAGALARLLPDATALREGASLPADCRCVVVTWPLDHPAAMPDRQATETFETKCLLPLFTLAKDWARRGDPLSIVLVGADTGGSAPRFSPALAAAAAMLKSVAMETPSLTVSAVAFPPDGGVLAAVAPRLGAAIGTPLGEASIRADGIHVRRLEPVTVEEAATESRNGAWLIIGGRGGIGTVLARHVATVHGAPVALLGRRPVVEAAPGTTPTDTTPLHLSADVTDPAALAAAIDRAEEVLGPIGTVVHAEMVLADAAAGAMTGTQFTDAWRPKAYGLTNTHAVFAARRAAGSLPRLVVFGSILGITGNAGQANYTAGSAYQMALAEGLAEGLAGGGADVRVLGWGYWGEVGRVANDRHRRRVARIGLLDMATDEALASFEAFLASPYPVIIAARLDAARITALTAAPRGTPDPAGGIAGLDALDLLAAARLHAAFTEAGWLRLLDAPEAAGIAAGQERLYQAAGAILRRHGWDVAPEAAPNPEPIAADILAHQPWLGGVVRLIDTAVPRIADVLRGTVMGTQVMFPEGDMDLVAGFYAGNRLADEANRMTARRVADLIAARLAAQPAAGAAPLRILEVGAGTGATTAPVLDALAPYGDRIRYVFSDLSPAFIRRARRRFGADRPWFAAERFDFDGDPDMYAELGEFDLILAANAVHVTADIGGMLDRLSRRLAPQGQLVLNELMRPMDHLTLTFGLLPGWWLAGDARAGFGPLLSPEGWRAALADRFDIISLDGVKDRDGLVQGVLAASIRPVPTISAPPGAAPDNPDDLMARVIAIVADLVQAAPESLAPDTHFADIGMDSILSLELVDHIAEIFSVPLDPAAIMERGTPARLTDLIAARGGKAPVRVPDPAGAPAPAPIVPPQTTVAPAPPAAANPSGEGIAIIGMAGTLPGADTLAGFMNRLATGESGIGPLPAGRWSAEETKFWGAESLGALKVGFVTDADQFDPALFGLSAREAMLMDPQQRLLLTQAWAALADAGRPQRDAETARGTGVFVGASGGDWTLKLAIAGKDMEAQSLSAQLPSSMVARLSHTFGFEGPAMTVDLACASGLAALHLAVEALQRGECRLALVGSVSLMATPQFPMLVARAGLLSPSGQPRPFSPDSDGIVLGEGAVVLVLKPLARARADGDRIHAVIEGSAVSQAGTSEGLSAPDAAAQAATLRRALAMAGVQGNDVAAIDAHGVGTRTGDAAEMAALAEVLGERARGLPLDTLKPAAGHMLAVSGLAAVARAALA
ncbi:SDR family NAD(P)-dependent oxidoreductase, partial [Azospirillum sp. B4]|uniref:SDR family NAD(P)-dependent oxidoreductase n=1 Tax=Azospirillum sp. B4 TaxID=95605 RepID=UPI0005C8D1CA